MERLQKVMAAAGIASRRHCEQMILDGQVKVNGHVVTKLPVIVDPASDSIVVGGRKLRPEAKVYFLLNKPKKVVCTNSDPQGRRRAIDLLGRLKHRVYPVGRLDTDSQGLLILTNDGDLANRLTHPRYGVMKTYLAEIGEPLTRDDIDMLKKGFHINSGKASMEGVSILRRGPKQSLLEITLKEGQNRQIRRMLLRLGKPVRKLTRTKIGPLRLTGLGPGSFRELTKVEVEKLRKLTSAEPTRKKRVKAKKPPPRRPTR